MSPCRGVQVIIRSLMYRTTYSLIPIASEMHDIVEA